MTKLVVFDLDGVLVDSRDLHYRTLNRAIEAVCPDCSISREEHLSTYDGLSTSAKLKKLTEIKGLPNNLYDKIWQLKQKYTHELVNSEYGYDDRIRSVLQNLKLRGFLVYVASNCIYKSVQLILLRKGFMEYVDYFISNEDVSHSKPNPEMYLKCMIRAQASCSETLIIEDSHIGREAAINSGGTLMAVDNPGDVTIENINNYLLKKEDSENIKWMGECNVVIPMAGEGSRFANVGYTFPKPLIDVNGKPMIQVVVENMGMDPKRCKFIFICRQEHLDKYNMSYLLRAIAPGCEIVVTDGLTEGAACSILLAKEHINNSKHLVLANSDQFMEWNPNEFMYSMVADDIDGGIATFTNSHPKWSYAKIDDSGFVCEVAEKIPISTHATTGIYYWKHGSDFVKYTEQMISKNIRVNNEFYTAPVFNEAILDGKKIKIHPIQRMWGIGVPEDLTYFLNHYSPQ
jgi:HAD superfamily hydrolase (TIGR01509 family)